MVGVGDKIIIAKTIVCAATLPEERLADATKKIQKGLQKRWQKEEGKEHSKVIHSLSATRNERKQ